MIVKRNVIEMYFTVTIQLFLNVVDNSEFSTMTRDLLSRPGQEKTMVSGCPPKNNKTFDHSCQLHFIQA